MDARPPDPTDAGSDQLRAIAIDMKKLHHRLDRFRKTDRDSLELQQASVKLTESRAWTKLHHNAGRFDS